MLLGRRRFSPMSAARGAIISAAGNASTSSPPLYSNIRCLLDTATTVDFGRIRLFRGRRHAAMHSSISHTLARAGHAGRYSLTHTHGRRTLGLLLPDMPSANAAIYTIARRTSIGSAKIGGFQGRRRHAAPISLECSARAPHFVTSHRPFGRRALQCFARPPKKLYFSISLHRPAACHCQYHCQCEDDFATLDGRLIIAASAPMAARREES